MMSEAPSHPPTSSFAPLRQKVFAVLWAATIIGNIGSFMRDVASAWLVTDLSGAPAAVALVQAAVAALGGKGGGGRPDRAQGGAPSLDNAEAAIKAVEGLLSGA